ncbi:MAG: hypothetical protein HWN65_19975 [Candidatus Helarchaeota archaeon]|nr:hypothetical protein [Candidatus Helarchaeota archaeon]
MEEIPKNDIISKPEKSPLDILERKFVHACFFSWLISIISIIIVEMLAAFINGWILLGLYVVLAVSCFLIYFFGYNKFKISRDEELDANANIFSSPPNKIFQDMQIDGEAGEKILWTGKQPTSVRAKVFSFHYLFLWITTFIPLIIGHTISIFFKEFNIKSIIFYSFFMVIILYLAQAAYHRWSALKDIYAITSRKIRWERLEEWAEMGFKEITRFEVKKTFFDSKELNTGSIYFYDDLHKKSQMEFNHIAQVDEIADLLTKNLPKLDDEDKKKVSFIQSESADESIPDNIIKRFSPTENLIFKVRNRSQERIDKIYRFLFIGIGIFYAIYIPVFIIFLEYINILSFLGILIPGCVALVAFLGKTPMSQRDLSIYVTDRRIYLHIKRMKFEYVKEIAFSNLRALNYQRGKTLNGRVVNGNLNFITGKRRKEEELIDYIPEVTYCRKIIESALYNYGKIENRWESIKKKMKLQFPAKFKVSQEGLKFMSERYRQTTRYIVLDILITLGIAYIFYIILPSLANYPTTKLMVQIMIIVLASIFGSIAILWWLVEKYKMRKRTSLIKEESQLTLYPHQIIFSGKKTQITVPLTEDISVDVLKIKKPLDDFEKWNIYDGIKIHSSTDSFIFGPLDNFWDIYEAIFCYIIAWKGEQGFLFSKEDFDVDLFSEV